MDNNKSWLLAQLCLHLSRQPIIIIASLTQPFVLHRYFILSTKKGSPKCSHWNDTNLNSLDWIYASARSCITTFTNAGWRWCDLDRSKYGMGDRSPCTFDVNIAEIVRKQFNTDDGQLLISNNAFLIFLMRLPQKKSVYYPFVFKYRYIQKWLLPHTKFFFCQHCHRKRKTNKIFTFNKSIIQNDTNYWLFSELTHAHTQTPIFPIHFSLFLFFCVSLNFLSLSLFSVFICRHPNCQKEKGSSCSFATKTNTPQLIRNFQRSFQRQPLRTISIFSQLGCSF